MNVLIIEDDDFKCAQLATFVKAEFPGSQIATAKSYQSGLCEAVEATPDVVLLDMNLPNYDHDGFESESLLLAGRDILEELSRLEIKTKVVVVTQFEQFGEGGDITTLDELSDSLAAKFTGLYCGTIYYHPSQEDWKIGLRKNLMAVTQT